MASMTMASVMASSSCACGASASPSPSPSASARGERGATTCSSRFYEVRTATGRTRAREIVIEIIASSSTMRAAARNDGVACATAAKRRFALHRRRGGSGSSHYQLAMDLTTSKKKFDSVDTRESRTLCCTAEPRGGGGKEDSDNNDASSSSSSSPLRKFEEFPGSSGRETSRRILLSSVLLVGAAALSASQNAQPALAKASTGTTYKEYIDRLDGYIFSYPSGWIQVKGAGADAFFRDPDNLDENVVVDFSSPSSSRYKSVTDLGTPKQAAQKVLKQKITEFMSTRLGVRRESRILAASSRVGEDGRLYYDIEVDVKSYANTNQLAAYPADRVPKLEWSRRYLSTLGVENNRLYELRLQAPERVWAEEGKGLRQIMNSFQLVKLQA